MKFRIPPLRRAISARFIAQEGVRPPAVYGLAWILYETNEAVYYLIPFNWICAFARFVYFHLRKGHPLQQDLKLYKLLNDREQKGYQKGYNSGYRKRSSEIENNISMFSPYTQQMLTDYINGTVRREQELKREKAKSTSGAETI